MNTTGVPEHIAPDGDAEILTLGVSTGLTDIVILFDVAVTGLAQVALDVITQVIISLLARPAFTYVVVLFPTLPPFSFHW